MTIKILLYKDYIQQKTTIEGFRLFLCTAEWCPPCKATKLFLFDGDHNYKNNTLYRFFNGLSTITNNPIINKLKNTVITFVIVDIDVDSFDAAQYGVRSIPSFILTDKNEKLISLYPGSVRNNEELQSKFANIFEKISNHQKTE